MSKGSFTVLEGVDGSGTTTQAQLIANFLYEFEDDEGRESKSSVLVTREPTVHSPAGKRIRRNLTGRLFENEPKISSPREWAELFVADRRAHLDLLSPLLDQGMFVISDRHKMSTLAYQSLNFRGRLGVPIEELLEMHQGLIHPDITFYLRVTPEVAAARRAQRSGKQEAFEKAKFQRELSSNYDLTAALIQQSDNVITIDGNLSIEEVYAEITSTLRPCILRKPY